MKTLDTSIPFSMIPNSSSALCIDSHFSLVEWPIPFCSVSGVCVNLRTSGSLRAEYLGSTFGLSLRKRSSASCSCVSEYFQPST